MTKQAEYKKIYIQESDELLQQMNKNLLIMEKEPRNENALNAIFRSAHTLKSMSASMGYNQISDLSHKMEDLLSQLRDKTINVTNQVVDILFRSFDSLEEMVGCAQDDKEITTDVAPLIKSLDSLMSKGMQFEEERVVEDVSLNIFEKKTLARVKKEGYATYLLRITLEKTCILKGVRAFMIFRSLHSMGEVIKSFPESQSLSEEKFDRDFSCVFVTKEESETVSEKVKDILEVEGVAIEEMPVNDAWDTELPDEVFAEQGSIASTSLGHIEQMRKIRSVRVNIEQLDKMMNLVEELAISKLRLVEIGSRFPDSDLKNLIGGFNRLTDDLQTEVMQARLVPVGQVFERFPRLVRDLAKQEEKKIKFDVMGADIELDRTVLDEIGDPLIHLVRNAVDHGVEIPQKRRKSGKPEIGRIMLSAMRDKSSVIIDVEDDGGGMDVDNIKRSALDKGVVTESEIVSMSEDDILMLTMRPGFSTIKKITDVSGRGVGLDVVKEKVESLGGSVFIETKAGKGTKIGMRLPVTTAVIQALLVSVLGRTFAIPISSVLEIIVVKESNIKKVEHQETILHRDRVLPIVRLAGIFSCHPEVTPCHPEAVRPKDPDNTLDSSPPAQNDKLVHLEPESPLVRPELVEGRDTRYEIRDTNLNIVVLESGKNQFGVVVGKLISQQDIVIKQLTKELKGIRGFAGATILGNGSVALVLDVATLI